MNLFKKLQAQYYLRIFYASSWRQSAKALIKGSYAYGLMNLMMMMIFNSWPDQRASNLQSLSKLVYCFMAKQQHNKQLQTVSVGAIVAMSE